MKFLVTAAVLAAALGASAAASATTFDFSYSFTDGQELTGSLEGTLNGTTISNIGDISLALNGTSMTGGVGPLQIVSWNTANLDSTDVPFDGLPVGGTPHMSAQDVADLKCFLETLTDGYVQGVTQQDSNCIN